MFLNSLWSSIKTLHNTEYLYKERNGVTSDKFWYNASSHSCTEVISRAPASMTNDKHFITYTSHTTSQTFSPQQQYLAALSRQHSFSHYLWLWTALQQTRYDTDSLTCTETLTVRSAPWSAQVMLQNTNIKKKLKQNKNPKQTKSGQSPIQWKQSRRQRKWKKGWGITLTENLPHHMPGLYMNYHI